MLYYWDTCIFITWLKNENTTPGLLDGINEVIKSVEKKESNIITSVITYTEMLHCKFSDDNYRKFEDIFKRPNIIACETTENIAKIAGEIRNYYRNRPNTPDAIHLATAITFEVEELHTSDGSGKKSGLISYNGKVASKYNIKIVNHQRLNIVWRITVNRDER